MTTEVPLLVLDVDGTVRQGKDDELGRWCNSPEDVVVFPEAVVGMMRWKGAGGRVIWASNQGGIAMGYVTKDQVHETMRETLNQTHKIAVEMGMNPDDTLVDRVAFCPHHTDAKDFKQSRCWCRKPSPGMIIEAATELSRDHDETYPAWMGLMVGDLPVDVDTARNAGLMYTVAKFWRAMQGTHAQDWIYRPDDPTSGNPRAAWTLHPPGHPDDPKLEDLLDGEA